MNSPCSRLLKDGTRCVTTRIQGFAQTMGVVVAERLKYTAAVIRVEQTVQVVFFAFIYSSLSSVYFIISSLSRFPIK